MSLPRRRGDPAPIFTRASRRRKRGRRVVLGVVLVAVIGGALAYELARGQGSTHQPGAHIRLMDGNRLVRATDLARFRAGGASARRRWIVAAGRQRARRRGKATVVLRVRPVELDRRLRKRLKAGGDVRVPYRPIASSISLPIVKQALRNNCETAALSMLLQARGVAIGQLALQRELPRSGPLDPGTGQSGAMLWGDPDQGFVGRAEGGGAAGGYGVYAPPIAALARRHGVRLRRLSGRSAGVLYAALLRGEPVLAWVGLSDGPFKSWRTPSGKLVKLNLGEHAVVLTGLRGNAVTVHDPLTGTVQTWTRNRFEVQWAWLGKRALSVPVHAAS